MTILSFSIQLVFLLTILKNSSSFVTPINKNIRFYHVRTENININNNNNIIKLNAAPNNNNLVNEQGFTRKQVLREETEAPFRSIRIFLYTSLMASAIISLFISGTGLVAVSSGVRDGNINELAQNTAINAAGIPVIGYLWKRDIDAKDSRLKRIQRGGQLAGLQVTISGAGGTRLSAKLSDFRRDRGMARRVIILAGTQELLKSSMESSIAHEKSLVQNDIMIVPVVIVPGNKSNNEDFALAAPTFSSILPSEEEPQSLLHIALPVIMTQWENVIRSELDTALTQTPDALEKGVTIIIKKNGKVGSRRFGVPLWETISDDVENRAAAGLDVSNI